MAVHKNPRFQKLVLVVIITIILTLAWPRTTPFIFKRPSFVSPQTSSPQTPLQSPKKPVKHPKPSLDRVQGWFTDAFLKSKPHRYSVKPIAYVLPGFHPFPEAEEVWGANWTEWDNVRKLTRNKYGLEIITPSSEIGYYDGVDFRTRRRQARFLLESGFYGAAFQHYWYNGKPLMDGVLNAMLRDGEPDIPFMLSWANEKWDEHYVAQEYGEIDEWRAHFEWLLPFFEHPKYIRSEGRVQFVVLNVAHMGNVANRMFAAWRQWAVEEGLGGLDIIETRYDDQDTEKAPGKAPADAIGEFQPRTAGNLLHGGYQLKRRNARVYHRGSMVCSDNTPRHTTETDQATINPFCHPMNFQYHVVEVLKKIKSDPNPPGSDNFFFVNALNAWGEGCALEPSAQFGDAYGKAFKNALTISNDIHHWTDERITEALQAESQNSTSLDVCVIVRTTSEQSDDSIFSLDTMLASLQAQKNEKWNALVLQTDQSPFENLEDLVSRRMDSRIQLAKLTQGSIPDAQGAQDFAAKAVDSIIEELDTLNPLCASANYILITDGKDTYEPRAFDIVSETPGDLVALNYESHRTTWNSVVHTQRCEPLQRTPLHMYEPSKGLCSHASRHARGGVPLGSLFVNLTRFRGEGHRFSAFPAGQPQSQDDHLVDMLRGQAEAGWDWFQPTDDNCYFMENPTYTSCVRTGNFWLDSPHAHERGCYGAKELQDRYGDDFSRWDLKYYRENGGCLRYREGNP